MKNLIIFYVIIFNYSFAIAQNLPYRDIEFKNLNPVWIYTPIDSSLIGLGNFDGRNHFENWHDRPLPYLIYKGYLYCAHHTRYSLNHMEGALLQKVDLQNGKVVWQNYWDSRNNDRQEWVEKIYLGDDGNLNVLTSRRIEEPKNDIHYLISGDSSLISIRKYDIENGELLDHIYTYSYDLNSYRIENSRNNETILYPDSDDQFQYYELDKNNGLLIQNDIDEKGHPVATRKTDTVKIINGLEISDPAIVIYKKIFKVSVDTLVSLDVIYNFQNPEIDTQTTLTIYNKNLQITSQFQIDSLLNFRYKRLYLVFANDKYIYINGEKANKSVIDTFNFIILNYEGNILKQFTGLYDNLNHILPFPLYLEDENEFLFASYSGKYYGFDIVKTNSVGEINLYREFYFKDKNYGYSPDILIQLDNSDVLTFSYTCIYENNKYFAYWPTWMRIRAEDLGLNTSILSIAKEKELMIYPNPANDYIELSRENTEAGYIEIIDQLGRIVSQENTLECEEKSIDISGLNPGLYFMRLINNSGREVGSGEFVKGR